MATREMAVQRRINAIERIKRFFPQVEFKRVPGGDAETQLAVNLEIIADAMEKKQPLGKDARQQ